MKVEAIIKLLIKSKLNYFAYFLLSLISIFLGRFSTFRLMENNLWLQKQGKAFFCDYSPNYRLNAEKEESFSDEIFFHGYRPSAGDICIDIGAGLGLDTRLMSEHVGNEGKVFSIEATERTFKALEICINQNKLENVISSYCAITNRDGTVKIADDIGHHTQNKITYEDSGSFSEVEGLTIDSYLEINNIQLVDYMKINIEGAEKLVIEKFDRIKDVKNLAISSHDFLGNRTGDQSYFTKDLITEFLKKNNFKYYSRNTGVDYIDGWIYAVNKQFID